MTAQPEAKVRMRRPMPPHRVYADFLAPDENAALLAWALANQDRFEPSQVKGKRVAPDVRRSLSLRDLGPTADVLRTRLKALAPAMVKDLRTTPFELRKVELELIAHRHEDKFGRHIDTFTGADVGAGGGRVLSCVYYFHREPKAFEGGALRLHAFGPEEDAEFVDIEPRQNTLLAFPAWAPHEVRAVSCPSDAFADARFSVNCWLHRARPET
jgi:SM-20-related protein